MHTLAFVFGTLFPIYATLALGAALRRSHFLNENVAKGLNSLMFWVALPCLIADSISKANFDGDCFHVSLVLILATLTIALLAWLLAPLLGISAFSRPSFCQSVFRSNNAYVGLPVMFLAFSGRPDFQDLSALATLTLAPCLITYNLLAVVLLTPKGEGGSFATRLFKVLHGILKNPLILACLAGVVLLLLRTQLSIELPRPVNRTMTLLGQMATPGSLIALGASLSGTRFRAALGPGHWAAALKLIVCPLCGLVWCLLFGLSPLSRFVVLTFLACPCAVASFIMAQAMKGDADLAGASVALSTVYSVFSLSIMLAFAMPPLP